MTNRIIVSDTDDIRRKVFALTKPLGVQLSEGSVLRHRGEQVVNHAGHAYTTGELGAVLNTLLSLPAVRELRYLSEWEVEVTIGPAFYWSDKSDGTSFYQHAVEAFIENWEGGTDVLVVTGGAPSYIEVHPGGNYSKLFICDRPITQAQGDHEFKKTNGAGRISVTSNNPDADKIGRAILLNPQVESVTINGRQIQVVGGYYTSGNYHYDAQITAEMTDYITGVLRANLYANEPVSVKPAG